MVTINIMIYTDTDAISEDEKRIWSVSILKNILETKVSDFVEFKLKVVNRYETPASPKKIDLTLLNQYDEVWMFGRYTKNVGTVFEPTFGGPENELDRRERRALWKWMEAGGVLIAGDHSEPAPGGKPTDPPDTFLCLGRALGKHVPRAGQLRDWEGPPTNLDSSSFNTLVTTAQLDVTNDQAQKDEVPQKLLLRIGSNDLPHPLFHGRNANGDFKLIDVFPDHRHEGQVIIPEKLNKEWPPYNERDGRKKPRPIIVADGCDKRDCHSSPVLAVYDGDGQRVGRIVADSSWHHYFDLNLRGLQKAEPNPAFQLLKQFYPNLALYLAPAHKRYEIAWAMLNWVVNHPEVREERGNEALVVGRVAVFVLAQVATSYEISEMLQTFIPDALKRQAQVFDFPPLVAGIRTLPPQELIIGAIVNQFFDRESAALAAGHSLIKEAGNAGGNIIKGLKSAFNSHRDEVTKIASVSDEYLKLLKPLKGSQMMSGGRGAAQGPNPRPKEATMADKKDCEGDWESKLDPKTTPKDDGVITISDAGGKLKGKHSDSDDFDVTCDGKTISFARVSKSEKKRIEYTGDFISDKKIEGTYTKTDAVKAKDGGRQDAATTTSSGDWEATKPTL